MQSSNCLTQVEIKVTSVEYILERVQFQSTFIQKETLGNGFATSRILHTSHLYERKTLNNLTERKGVISIIICI